MNDPAFDISDKANMKLVNEFEVEYEDVMHLKNLYKLVYEWFWDKEFRAVQGDDDKIENFYFQRELEGGAQEHHAWWRVKREPDNSPYIRYYILFEFQTLNTTKTTTEKSGHKLKTNKSDVIMRCQSYLRLDYKQQWSKSKFLNFFHERFKGSFYKETIDYYKVNLYQITNELESVIKQYLKLKNPQDLQKPFHPEQGV